MSNVLDRPSGADPTDSRGASTGKASVAAQGAAKKKLAYPPGVQWNHWIWAYVVGIGGIHLLSLLVFLPYCFSWTGVIVAVLGIHIFGQGITLHYHRLLTHRSFRVSKWLERCFTTIALCCLQDTPAKWVCWHRMHHNHSDDEEDPHSPLVNFWWGHFGWLMVQNRGTHDIGAYYKFAHDILDDPFYMALEKKRWLHAAIYAVHALLFYLVGLAIGWLTTGSLDEGVRFGVSLMVWGAFLRTVLVWHITWSVNSVTHLFGYRNYETGEGSRNNWIVAVLAAGEGWHNNHHHDQASVSNQHRWWEFDLTYYEIKLMEKLGLARDLVPPRHLRRAARAAPNE